MLAPEPGALALGVLPSAPLRQGDGGVGLQFTPQQPGGLAVADRFQQGAVGPEALDQLRRLLHQAAGEQGGGAAPDALGQVGRIQAQLQHPPGGGERPCWADRGLPVA